MLIQIKNLGPLRQAEFSLGDMTILCGRNNTGKTYASYALFGFLSFWRDAFSIHISETVIDQLLAEGAASVDSTQYLNDAQQILADGCRAYAKHLPKVFAAPAEHFKDVEFQVVIDPKEIRSTSRYDRKTRSATAELFSITKREDSSELEITLLIEKQKARIPRDIIRKIIGDALKEVVFGHLFPNPFIASAERTGAAIFRKDLNFPRNRMMEQMSKSDKNINPIELLFKVYEDYALPVKTNVEFLRQLEMITNKTSYIADNHPELLAYFEDIVGGAYHVTRNDELYYVPKGKRLKLGMDESSSSVRSLLDIGFFLRHVAQLGDLLIVDEPELNLHPENQCRVARLFARLINLGLKVFITTHSDYIVKELNTLIMLNHDKPHLKRIAEEQGYEIGELLSPDKVKVYVAEEAPVLLDGGRRKSRCQTLTPADIDPFMGIEVSSFDKTIERMNRIQEEILYGEE